MTYALALDNPPLLVVSDSVQIIIHTHFTGTPSEKHTIAIEDIGTSENLQKLRWLFEKPNEFKPQRTRTAITLQAAKLIGDLAWQMQQRKHDPQQVAHFLNKIIFCLFAEDARGPASPPLLPDRLFSKILETGEKDIARFQRQLKNLFHAMSDRHGEFGEHLIQWFNGGLFDDDLTLPLTQDDIQKLINVGLLDWSAIEPSIFGTLFERGMDPAKRSQLGAHYTDPVSIMRIVNPVIVEPLLEEWRIEQYTNLHAHKIAAAAHRLNQLRENWLNPPEWVDVIPEVVAGYPDRINPKPEFAKAIKARTLTNLYNARQKGEVQWLEDAHRTLDSAVARAYGWDDYTPEMPDEEILRRLLKLNQERAAR